MRKPYISICIPTYNRTQYLPRLFDSIISQSFKDYDIIITDNTQDDRIEKVIAGFSDKLNIRYHKNQPALNMTGNWNRSFELADGEWIKLMHDDDWFATETALEDFVAATKLQSRFIYCGRYDHYEDKNRQKQHVLTNKAFSELQANPLLLYADNIIGPPSLLMFHNSVKEYYDEQLQWFVDIEYYIRMLKKEPAVYINKPLVCINYGSQQVTNYAFNNPTVQIPEILYIAETYGLKDIKADIRIYDAFWRMMRNLNIRSIQDIRNYCNSYEIPGTLTGIIKAQTFIPQKMLRSGPISKLAMGISYVINK